MISAEILDLENVSDDELVDEYQRRFGCSSTLDRASDREIEDEFKSRCLTSSDDQYEEEEIFKLADDLINDLHSGKVVYNRVLLLLERITGRIVCK